MKNKQTFQIKTALAFGLKNVQKRKALIIKTFLLVFAMMIIYSFAMASFTKKILYAGTATEITISLPLISALINIAAFLIIMSIFKISLKIYEKKKVEALNIFKYLNPKRIIVSTKLIITHILFSLLIGLGMMLLVIPGIYWSVKYCFTLMCILDKKTSIFKAFNTSAKITNGNKWNLFNFMLTTMLLTMLAWVPIIIVLVMDQIISINTNVFGFLITMGGFIGLLWLIIAIPTIIIAYAYIFKKLQKQKV